MPRQHVSLEPHKNKILWILHNSIAEEENKVYQIDDLTSRFKIPLSIVELSIDELEDEKLCNLRVEEAWSEHPITGQDVSHNVKYITITSIGIATVEGWDDKFYDEVVESIFSSIPGAQYEEYLSESDGELDVADVEIPASDRYVTINHNKKEVKEAIRTLDSAIQEFKEDNLLDNKLGQEKAALVGALEAGRKLLDDTKVWLGTAISILVQPLKRIATKYKEATIQGGASAIINLALNHLLSLFGPE